MKGRTLPKSRFPTKPPKYKPDPATLAAGRYGTEEMIDIWGPEQTFKRSLYVQGQSAMTMSELYPEVVPRNLAQEIKEKASLKYIDPDRIREIEEKTGHDVFAINNALEEVLSPEARTHVNKAKTSADTTQPARALQLKESLGVIIDSVENLRDIILEKSMEWINVPHMDTSHWLDALPTVVGRPFSHYGEMLQYDLDSLKFSYDNSIKGKWADATGNHHSATALGIDGVKLQEEFCKALGIGYMDAPAQVPGLEFEANICFSKALTGETMNNIANYLRWGKGDDVNIFFDAGKKRKGSTAMPHKDAKGGNPTAEEQVNSLRNYLAGNLATAMMNCKLDYARELSASANSRINLEDGFKFMDHGTRRLADTTFNTGLNEKRCKERVDRTHGVTTSQQVTTYLTDHRKTDKPMGRKDAHGLMGELATYAWTKKIPFVDVVLENEKVTNRLEEPVIRRITDPYTYIGNSKEIVKTVFDKYHKKKTLQ